MVAGRRVSQDQTFLAALRGVRKSEATAKGGVGKGAAERALQSLEQGGASPADQALVVQRFLDSKDATALSPKAREALLAFVAQRGAPVQGESATEVRRAQRGPQAGEERAQAKVLSLLKHSSTPEEKRARAEQVGSWLDHAEADLAQAGARLAALALGKTGGTDELRPTRVEALRRAFGRLDRAGTLSWTPGGVAEQHLGVRFVRVELMKERRPDGFTFAAYVPVGALAPGAPSKDPNQVREFYVERSGGLAGLTLSVGPLRL